MSVSVNNYNAIIQVCKDMEIKPPEHMIRVAIGEQKMYLYRKRKKLAEYKISSSVNPPSCREHSYGTPLGLHEIKEKIGDGEALGMVFKNRKPTGQRYWEYNDRIQKANLITTRILWLNGLEEGENHGAHCDTYSRAVYIHGTNKEDELGTPISKGCILMKNEEVLQLFNTVGSGTLVYIHE